MTKTNAQLQALYPNVTLDEVETFAQIAGDAGVETERLVKEFSEYLQAETDDGFDEWLAKQGRLIQ